VKYLNQVRKYGAKVVTAGVALTAAPLAAFAGGGSGPDYSELTGAIDFDDVAPIILGGGAALLTLYVLIKGVKIVIAMVRS
jgi:hypothetical protein